MQSDHSSSSSHTPAKSGRRNILIVGDVGVGKSSLVNLITGDERAVTSGGATSCTLHSEQYLVAIRGVEFALHDTAGLHEAHGMMKPTEYLDAVHQACTLISKLEQSGGINLLVFCMKGGRISNTTQETYNLFVDVLCNCQVPVVIAVTHLEHCENMEEWWEENEGALKDYGLRSLGHACITTTRGYKNIFSNKYERSRGVMERLLLDYSDGVTWKEEKGSWVKRLVLHMRSWLGVKPLDGSALQKKLKKKLVKQCGFSVEDAEQVAQKIVQSRNDNQNISEKLGAPYAW